MLRNKECILSKFHIPTAMVVDNRWFGAVVCLVVKGHQMASCDSDGIMNPAKFQDKVMTQNRFLLQEGSFQPDNYNQITR